MYNNSNHTNDDNNSNNNDNNNIIIIIIPQASTAQKDALVAVPRPWFSGSVRGDAFDITSGDVLCYYLLHSLVPSAYFHVNYPCVSAQKHKHNIKQQ